MQNTKLKIILSVIGIVTLTGGLIAGVLLVQRQQQLEEQAAPATSLTLNPASQEKSPGDEVTFNVSMNTGSDPATANKVVVFDVEVSYNPEILEVTSVTKGSFAASFSESRAPIIDNATGRAFYSALTDDDTQALSGQGDIVTIAGRIKDTAAAGSSTNLQFSSRTIIGDVTDNQNVLVDKSGATIKVAGGAVASPSPAASPLASATPTASPRVSPSPSSSPRVSPSPSSSPRVSPSPSPSPSGGNGGPASPTPSPSPSVSPSPSSAPAASPTPTSTPNNNNSGGTGGNASTPTPSPSASASATASTNKPTVSLPASNTVKAGDTITGTAAPNSTVNIKIESKVITATVKANAQGKWSYTLPADIEPGTHTLTITDSKGTTVKTFKVAAPTATLPEAGMSLPTIIAVSAGIIFMIVGLVLAL